MILSFLKKLAYRHIDPNLETKVYICIYTRWAQAEILKSKALLSGLYNIVVLSTILCSNLYFFL